MNARFIGGNNPFTLASGGGEDNSLFYGTGISALFKTNVSLSLKYVGQTYNHDQAHSLVASLEWDLVDVFVGV